MTTQTETTKEKQVPSFYIFENGPDKAKGGKPVGAAFSHKKGNGFTILVAGKRYAAFPPKTKAAGEAAEVQPPVQPDATQGSGA